MRKWKGDKISDIASDYRENPYRLYEVFSEEKNIGSRLKAKFRFEQKFPKLVNTTDFSPHESKRKVVRKKDDDEQGSLF